MDVAARTSALVKTGGEHVVHFYESDENLTEAVAEFLAGGLESGEHVVVVASEARRRAFTDRLKARGFDVEDLSFLDADDTLSKLMTGSMPEAARFQETVGAHLERLMQSGRRVRAYGEMVDILWKDGKREAAIRLEELWNEAQKQYPFSLYCAYLMGRQYGVEDVKNICAAHSHVKTAESDSQVLENESHALLAEIAQRKQVEQALREALEEQRRTQDDLRRSHALLRDFVDNASVGLHWVGEDGKILWANRAELDMFGYEEHEYVGHHIAEFHADRAAIDDILCRLANNETLHNYEARIKARDGSTRHVLISSNVYREGGKFVHTRCFTKDITAQKRAENELRESQHELQTITDALPTLVSYIDSDLRYRTINLEYQRWFGHPRSELIGRSVREVLGDAAFTKIEPKMRAALAGHKVTYQTTVKYRFGGERTIEATYIPHHGPDGVKGFTALVADISERTKAEQARNLALQRTERLTKITGAIADAVTPEEVFDAVVAQTAVAIGASSAGLWLSKEGEYPWATLVRDVGYSERAKQGIKRVSLESQSSVPVADAMRSNRPIWIDSQKELLEKYPHIASYVTAGRDYRIACLPLRAPGKSFAALAFTFDGAPPIDGDERALLLLVAGYAGQALERLRLLEGEQASREQAELFASRMAVLSRASRSFAEAGHDLSALLQAVVEQVASEHADGCLMTLLSNDGDTLELVAAHHRLPEAISGIIASMKASPPRVGEGTIGLVAQTGKPLFLTDIEGSALVSVAKPEHRSLPHGVIIVPLKLRKKIIGVLKVVRQPGKPSFTPEDLSLMQELADRAALAIESSRLYRDNKAARQRSELLYTLTRAVIDAKSVEEVYDAAIGAIESALDAKRSAVLLYDRGGVMRFKAWRGLSDAYRAAVEGHSPWSRDEQAPLPVLVGDVAKDPAWASFRPLFAAENIGALGFIPLIASGSLLGKFMVYYDAPRVLTPIELELARAIANHVAAAVARFSAHEELQQTVRLNEMFTAILGHDLRNPLASIMTAAQLMTMRAGSEKNAKPLARILNSGNRMARMIDQLLDFTRVRMGSGIPLQTAPLDLALLLRQVMDELDDANPDWTLHLEQQGETSGNWDEDRLGQVFSNLIGNALQHGSAEHGLRVRLDGNAVDHVIVEVQNMGVIPSQVLPRLFEPMGGGERRSSAQGLGLGLFITQQIARAHGGSVTVRSSADEGTTFTVVLPRGR